MRSATKLSTSLKIFLIFISILIISFTGAAKGAGPEEMAIEGIAKKVSPSVVKVETRNGLVRVATGVVLDKDGTIITTALISPRDEKIMVTTTDGQRGEAKFLGLDPETHLALVQAKGKNFTPIPMGKTDKLAPGSWIGVISVSPENTPAVTQGIISSVAADKLRLNVWVTRGASGSPVVNKDGQMVALLRGIYTDEQPVVFEFREKEVVGSGYVFSQAEAPSSGMALAIPIEIVKSVSSEIKEKGKVSRGWLGVSIAENEQGQVEIQDIRKDSPAELAGLKEGDILLKVEGEAVASAAAFVSAIRSRKSGQDIHLEIERGGKIQEIKVKLGEFPEDEARRELELRFPRIFPPLPVEPPQIKPERAPGAPRAPESRFRFDWPRWEKRKYIGVYLEAINKELLEFFGVKEESGLLVSRVTKDGPAAKAGIRVGDVIVRVDGKKVDSVDELSRIIQDKKKGDQVKIELVRDKKSVTVEVEVDEEERQRLGWDFGLSREAWEDFSRQLEQQYEKSRGLYEELNQESLERMKKMGEELREQVKKLQEEASKVYEKSQEEYQKLRKHMAKKGVLYTV
ncbi:MAG: PDZ domain-containing protein [Candidatus Aminicenantales bacterium]